MKKYIIMLAMLCLILACGWLFCPHNSTKKSNALLDDVLFINAQYLKKDVKFKRIKKLEKVLNQIGVDTVLNSKGEHKEGNINLYIAENKYDLPEVKDLDAINVLWFPYIDMEDDFEIFRKFDVVLVKSFASFLHLKAINVRTAFIPDAIDMKKVKDRKNNKRILYYGNNSNFSLVLYLTKGNDVDIIGEGWEHTKYADKVIKTKINKSDFTSYPIILVDQTDEEIKKYLVNDKVTEVLENGGRLMIRYNPGVEKMYDDSILMYHNVEDFYDKFEKLKSKIENYGDFRDDFYDKSANFDTNSVANKIVEIFQIMKKKRI